MATKRTSVKVFGDYVNVALKTCEQGWCCEYDDARNRADTRRDLMTFGYGGSEAEAIKAYVASCHRREQGAPGELYGHDSAMQDI